ncbi:Centromere Cenp-H protein [Rutstroemia sp. NJR-2017a BBW]|nr:Centromere Cenp-H protein [Rutstroemia sp. NJR-2017a BBW]
MEGIEFTGSANESPPLTDQEQRILDMYDKLEELQFEVALLKAQAVLSAQEQPEVSQGDIEEAQKDLLQAKASYSLRGKIIENAVIANPILKAVHAGNNASIIEHLHRYKLYAHSCRDLLPLIQQRDTASEKLAQLSNSVYSARDEINKVSIEHIVLSRKNVELSNEMLSLADQANANGKNDIKDPEVRAELDGLEAEMKTSKQRWRVMKNTASAVIVGSGVDWARDPKLLEIVLDDDGDDG